MKVLAIDSAAAACSAAVWTDGVTLAWRRDAMVRGHSEALIPMVRDVLAEAGMAAAALDMVAATVGPGAFTGIRIGLAAARGIALAAGVPCAGVTTLEAAAAAVPADERRAARTLLVALDTKRQDVYAQAFDPDGRACGAPMVTGWEDFARLAGEAPVVVAGDAAAAAVAALVASGRDAWVSTAAALIDPRLVAAIAARRHASGLPPVPPEPVYLRPAYATVARD